jgi:hypothetical protein
MHHSITSAPEPTPTPAPASLARSNRAPVESSAGCPIAAGRAVVMKVQLLEKGMKGMWISHDMPRYM